MYIFIYELVKKFTGRFSDHFTSVVTYIACFAIILSLCVLLQVFAHLVTRRIIEKAASKRSWISVFLENRFFYRLSWLAFPVVISFFRDAFNEYNELIEKTAGFLFVIVITAVTVSFLNSIGQIYNRFGVSKTKPIKGLLQIIKAALYIISAIILISMTINKSAVVLLGGIGALTAVTSIIFKDAILGFVAGIQLTANDMVRIGDWIEMSDYKADGTVIDLSLTTIKIRNFDNTVTSIPAYALVSDSFINWRGMVSSGGRRIKRAISVDVSGIRICDNKIIDNLITAGIISEGSELLSSAKDGNRRLTNLGLFRAFINDYLKNHPLLRKDMALMVRQLASDGRGIPLEIYAFAATTKWEEFENIQADIFDYLYSVIGLFELQVFQQPSGNDYKSLFR